MAGPIDPRTLAIIQAMEPAAAQRQVMQAGLRIAPAPQMGMDEFADVRNPIPQPRGPMTAPQPSADMLVPPDTPNVALQPMRPYMGSNTFNVPIGPKPDRFAGDWRPGIPGFESETRAIEGAIGTPEERLKAEFSRRMQGPPKPPAGNMLAPDVEETGSVAPAPAPVAPAPGNRLEAPMPAPAPAAPAPGNQLEAPMPTGRRVYDPAAGTNGPRFIYEGGPAPMPAAGRGSAIATGGGAVPAAGGAGGVAMPYSGGGEGGGVGDGFFDFLGGFSRGGLLGGIQGVHLGKKAREGKVAEAQKQQQGLNMTVEAARRLGIPNDMITALTATGNTKALADVIVDVHKQRMQPKEAKAPDLQEIYDPETGRKRMAIIQPDGTPKFVGGVEAPESDVLSPEAEAQKIRLANAGKTPGAPDVRTIKQADGSEVAVQWDPASNAWKPMPAPEGGAAVRGAPKLTETQSKDVGFYNRGIQAADRLNEFEAALLDPVDDISGRIPFAGNYLVGKDKQQADQAGREFLAVILRKDTGAAVTPQEMDVYGKMYIPAPGDSQEVLAQKREARQTAIESIRLGLGSVGDQVFGGQPVVGAQPSGAAPTNDDPLGIR
jgi:hypothetical protein